MVELSELHARGERARLFPVLADTSKEGRTLSIVLASLSQVPEFAASMLSAIGRRPGRRTKVSCFTEVTFPAEKNLNVRPDGLMVVDTGRSRWTALVEAKVGKANLKADQVEAYLRLARSVGVDAVITISNDFAALPEHHPLDIDKRLTKKVQLFHFSWFSLLTSINLLAINDEVDDDDHKFLLRELERFLLHDSAGLRRFDQMGSEWKALIDRVRSGTSLAKSGDDTMSVVAEWHAVLRDLCLLLSRRTGASVDVKLNPKERADPRERLARDAKTLAEKCLLDGKLNIPAAAAPIELEADIRTATVRASIKLEAPKDKSQQRSRLNWLLRQLKDVPGEDIQIFANWPGRAPQTCSTLAEAVADHERHSHPDKSLLPVSFTVMQMMTDGRRFAGRKTFIESVEALTSEFYGNVAQHLEAWRPPAPRLRSAVEEGEDEPSDDGADDQPHES